jgi:hypothetical protein
VGFVVVEPCLVFDCDRAYGYADATVADLDLDSGYNGYVMFETRWYGVADSYADYVSNFVIVSVSN